MNPTRCPCCGAPLDPTPIVRGPDRLQGTPGEFEVAACGSCGAGITIPPVESGQLGAFYPESYAPYDAARAGLASRVSALIQRLQGRRALRTAPFRALAGSPPGRAIDVGCGRGDMGAFLIERGWSVTGIEPSANACATARARGLDARQGTLEDVELEAGTYDAAIFRHSLEHVTDPVAALSRVREALRPGGMVLISVPNFSCWQRRRFGSRWFHLDLPRHRVHLTSAAMLIALERAGFEATRLSTSTSPVGLPGTIQYAIAGRCLFSGGLPLRVAAGLSALFWPAARLADGLGGGGDVLNAFARRPAPPPGAGERQRYDRAADLGPRGLELRHLLDEFAAENRDDPIAATAVPALVTLAQLVGSELGPAPSLPRKRHLREYHGERRRLTRDDPGHPGEYYLAGGVLFQADGPNHLRPADPIMRRLGEPRRPPPEIRASKRRLDAGARRAVRLARRFFSTARRRGVWVPPDVPYLYTIFIGASHSLAHADALLNALSPRAAAVLATPNPGPRTLVYAARRAGIPSIYFPHAPALMDPSFNDLPTDFAGLRGPREVDYYAEVTGSSDRIEVVGDPSIGSEEVPAHDPSLPPVLAPSPDEHELRRVVEVVQAAVGDSVLLSPHPHADLRQLKAAIPAGWEIWTDRTFELLRRGPPMLMQSTSGVALEALMLGIPTIELKLPADRAITYPLIREPYVRVVSNASDLRGAIERSYADVRSDEARERLRDWARQWSSPWGEEAAKRGAALVERAAAAPPPGPIWSAWPDPRP